jgi:hypothetical protein
MSLAQEHQNQNGRQLNQRETKELARRIGISLPVKVPGKIRQI